MDLRDSTVPLLSVRGLTKTYWRRNWIGRAGSEARAIRGVDLDLHAGRTIAVVGASGAGKSTLARCIAGIDSPTSGEIFYRGDKLENPASVHRHIQLIFQDPGASLNARFSVADALQEPATIRGERVQIVDSLQQVGLPATSAQRATWQLSGGQKARLALARALVALGAPGAGVLILDESLANLDLSVQAQMINLLLDLQEKRGLAYILIAHDLRLAAQLADEVAVMFEGQIVERGAPRTLFGDPKHVQTAYLVGARTALDGTGPNA